MDFSGVCLLNHRLLALSPRTGSISVHAGATHSISREPSSEDAIRACKGLRKILRAVDDLLGVQDAQSELERRVHDHLQ